MSAWRDCCRHQSRRVRRQLAGNGKRRRIGNQPRTTASGVDAHRHQTRVLVQSSVARLPAVAGLRFAERCPSRAGGLPSTGVSWRSGTRVARLPSTTSDRATKRFCSHLKSEIGSRRTGEFLEFMNDGGYRRPELWLSLGWSTLREQQWAAPLYWIERDGSWHEFSLGGLRPLNLDEPVCHVSYFEADAFARWSGARLPTEAEWEHAAAAARTARAASWKASVTTRHRSTAMSRSCSNVRRSLAMDGQPLRRLSRLCAAPGHAGRIQRQVHVQSICAARRIVCSRPPATYERPTAISFRRTRGGSSPVSVWPATSKIAGGVSSSNRPASPVPETHMLEFRGVSKSFGGTTVVQPLDLLIERGEVVVLLGPSGCGKTTILRMVAGLVSPTSGQIIVDSIPLAQPDHAFRPAKAGIRGPGRAVCFPT